MQAKRDHDGIAMIPTWEFGIIMDS
jgi:hypothetical protein